MSLNEKYLADFNLAERCLQGEPAAILELQENYRSPITALLMRRVANGVMVDETVKMLWADLLTPNLSGRCPLSRYNGTCALMTYLGTVATNFLLPRLRKAGRHANRFTSSETEEFTEPCGVDVLMEEPLIALMREAITYGFASCRADHFVMFYLLYFGGLTRPELERMFVYKKTTLQRELALAFETMRERTLGYVRQRDPWLDIRWEDFLEICQTATLSCYGIEE